MRPQLWRRLELLQRPLEKKKQRLGLGTESLHFFFKQSKPLPPLGKLMVLEANGSTMNRHNSSANVATQRTATLLRWQTVAF